MAILVATLTPNDLDLAIVLPGMKVLVCCRTDCGVGRQSGLVTKRHYHCPECVTVWSSHTLWRKHLSLDHGIQTEDELVSGEQCK